MTVQEENTTIDEEEKVNMPSNAEVKRAADELAWSPKIDLDAITHVKFRKILSKRMGVDLSPKKKLVTRVLDSCKAEWDEVCKLDNPHPYSAISPSSSTSNTPREVAIQSDVIEVVKTDSPKKPPPAKKVPRTRGIVCWHNSWDLDQRRCTPKAADLSQQESHADTRDANIMSANLLRAILKSRANVDASKQYWCDSS